MARFATLLRGVNIGGGNRVPMVEFRSLLQRLGYTSVATLLNSGNAVFTSSGRSTSRHAERIRAAVRDTLGVDVPVIVKSAQDLLAIRNENPIPVHGAESSRLLVGFAPNPAALAAFTDLISAVRRPERFHVGSHGMFVWCPDGVAQSATAKVLMGKRGRAITTRNWATLLKLIEMTGWPGAIRIITARRMTRGERKLYEEG